MSFQDNLANMPAVDHLSGLEVLSQEHEVIHRIPAIQGKLGSLRLYNALAQEFDGILNVETAEHGLALFAEHVADAEVNPGKHPNIDLLFKVKNEKLTLLLNPVKA